MITQKMAILAEHSELNWPLLWTFWEFFFYFEHFGFGALHAEITQGG